MTEPRILKLERPLVSFDLETTGLDRENDRIVEISCVRLGVNLERDVKTRRVNPGIPISADATAIHGITDADVKDEPTFAQLAKSLLAFISGCDLTGFNVRRFDLPMLQKEFSRAGITYPAEPVRVVDSWRIFVDREPHDLAAAYRMYCKKGLERAHSAECDAVAAAEILQAQLEYYPDLPLTVPELHLACNPEDWVDPDGKFVWKDGQAVVGFGKHKDRSLESLAAEDPSYLRWMASANFSPEVIAIARRALEGSFPVKKAV
jgi:DNA polymerase-3 subunit epsilon